MSDKAELASCQCMCGAVRFKAKLKNHEVRTCHCSMCRQWTGGVFLALGFDGDLDFNNSEELGVYKSSDWGERGFCKTCGSSLFWRMQDRSLGGVSAQAVENLTGAKLHMEMFIDDKPGYYNFAEPTEKMTGAQVMAAFAPKPK